MYKVKKNYTSECSSGRFHKRFIIYTWWHFDTDLKHLHVMSTGFSVNGWSFIVVFILVVLSRHCTLNVDDRFPVRIRTLLTLFPSWYFANGDEYFRLENNSHRFRSHKFIPSSIFFYFEQNQQMDSLWREKWIIDLVASQMLPFRPKLVRILFVQEHVQRMFVIVIQKYII